MNFEDKLCGEHLLSPADGDWSSRLPGTSKPFNSVNTDSAIVICEVMEETDSMLQHGGPNPDRFGAPALCLEAWAVEECNLGDAGW